MFKSVFTKYLTTFTLIIFFSFLILILVMSSILSSYSMESKGLLMDKSSEMKANNLNAFISISDKKDIEWVVENYKNSIQNNLVAVGNLAGSDIYIVSPDGKILVASEDISKRGNRFSSRVVQNIFNNNEMYALSKLDGYFKTLRLNHFYIIEGEEGPYALVMVSSKEVGDPVLTSRMTKTLVLVSLWIFLAALISVYFISERIVQPLRDIGVVAKDFSMSKFDRRVKVTGKDEVSDLAVAFNNMAENLANLEEMRSSFLANVSHDLRTPMTTISGFVDGILDGTIPEDKHDHYLGIISSEVKRLSRLVDSLLKLSKTEAGESKLNKTIFNLSETTRQVLLSFEGKLDGKDLDINFENPKDIKVKGDTDVLYQVIYNLIENAVKFTPDKGSITISLSEVIIDKKTKKAKFSITNTGPGIPAEEMPYLFDRFYKSDRSRGLEKSGTGLGLYIVKTSLLNHGEEIKVYSETDRITEFSFMLPIPGNI